MTDWLETSAASAQKLRVRSALNPVLWLTGIASPVCFLAATALKEEPYLMWIVAGVGFLPILTACAGFFYFALKKPEKLQSEDYQLRHETLQMIQKKGGPILIDVTSLEGITNPTLPALPQAEEER